jgi:threonine/homoserine/homoserine lactone efflux protein
LSFSTGGSFAALLLFSFVSSVTPGPNNMMLLASGLNYGFRRTVPHLLGVTIGFTLMVALIGLGLGQVFAAVPLLYTLLKIIGTIYMLWLAWKIANAAPPEVDGQAASRPMTFLEAALFQWVNPKAWMMAVSANATYLVLAHPVANALLVAAVFGVINLPSVAIWVSFGARLRQVLANPRLLTLFNRIMAGLLVVSLWPVLSQ